MDTSHKNKHFIENIKEKLLMLSLHNCLKKELKGLESYQNNPDPIHIPTINLTPEQYMRIRHLKGFYRSSMLSNITYLSINPTSDISISIKIQTDFIDYEPNSIQFQIKYLYSENEDDRKI